MHIQQELSQSAEYFSSWRLYFQLATLFSAGDFFLGVCIEEIGAMDSLNIYSVDSDSKSLRTTKS